MNVNLSYDEEFGNLLSTLNTKYGAEIFEIEGIGSQLDLNKFSQAFFSTKTTSDASIDANANVGDSTVVSYSVELTKPYEKLNSLYLLWKEMRRLFHTDVANEIIEMHISGDIYIHDLHSVNKPYSYYKHTTLMVNNELTTMEDLFNNNSLFGDIDNESTEVYVSGLSVTDVSGNTNISRIIRHKPHNKLLKFETKDGHVMIVTEDHPMILSDMSEKLAKDITTDDVLYVNNPEIKFYESFNITDDYAYIIGFWLGDGTYAPNTAVFIQNDIINSKIYSTLSKYFDVKILADNRCVVYNKELIDDLSKYGLTSNKKKLPNNIHKWSKSAINSFICGLIDAEGTIMPTGCVMIRMNAYGLLHGLRDILINMDGYQHVRMSFYEHDKSQTAYNLNYDMYRLSFRAPFDIIKSSEKMNNHIDRCMRHVNKDGRFESGQVHKIATLKQQEQYVYDITTDSGHFISGGLLVHNCFNYSTYDIMNKGLPMITKIKSVEPKHLYSFKSQLEQFVVIASNSTLGATGIADVLIVMSYYVKNILASLEDAHFTFKNEDAVWTYVKETLTSLVYTLNQPFRGGIQSAFTNVSVFDKSFLEDLSAMYIFPDGSAPDRQIIYKLQDIYIDVMNETLERTAATFPVTTAACTIDNNRLFQNPDDVKYFIKKNLQFGFMNFYAGKSTTLSSCCRLRSDMESIGYANSIGGSSTKIGSVGVGTVNMYRAAVKANGDINKFNEIVAKLVGAVARVNHARRTIIRKKTERGFAPLYKWEFISLDKQFSTCGINGFYEAIEALGEDLTSETGLSMAIDIIARINAENAKYDKAFGYHHNCEQVPGESLSVKIAEKDKILGFNKTYALYSNQFIPLTATADILERIRIQGALDSHFSGGSILHLNFDKKITDVDAIYDLLQEAVKQGVVYMAINYVLNECEDGHISVGKIECCPTCSKSIVNEYTRVVGFLSNVKNWNKTRRVLDYPNRKFY